MVILMTKLTLKQRDKIAALYSTGDYTYRELGRRFGVTATVIGNIVLKKYPHHKVNWTESATEQRLRAYAEYYEKKAQQYRKQYETTMMNRLHKEMF